MTRLSAAAQADVTQLLPEGARRILTETTPPPDTARDDELQLVAADWLLTVPEAAERLGTTQRFVRRLVEQRRIRVVKIGKFVRFLSTDLDDFLLAGIRDALPRQ